MVLREALYKRIGKTLGVPAFLYPLEVAQWNLNIASSLFIKNDYHPKLYYDFSKRLAKTTKSIRSAVKKLALSNKLFYHLPYFIH